MSLSAVLSRFFSRPKVTAGGPPLIEERDSVIAAIDQAPYTVSETPAFFPPALMVQKLNDYLEIALAVISASGGQCLRHVGCAIIAEWPIPRTQSEQQTLGAGLLSIVEQTRSIAITPALKIRPIIGVSYGHTIHSTHNFSGNEVRLEMGPAVTRASQLCSMCARYKAEILFYEGTPLAWPSSHAVESLGPVVIAGVADQLILQTVRAGVASR